MTFLSKCLSLMLTQTPCHKAAQCTSSGLIKAEHTEYRGTESQVYCFHSDITFFFLCSSPVKWKKAQLHNEMIIWPGFFKKFLFFLIHIYGDVQYFPTTSSRCGVAVPASKSAAEQTGEDITGPGNNAVLITVSAKKPANSSEASPDQSTSSCWLCYSCTHSKHRTGFVLLFLVLQH